MSCFLVGEVEIAEVETTTMEGTMTSLLTAAASHRSGSVSRSYDERARLLGGGRRSTPQFPASYTSIGDLTPRRGGHYNSSLNIRPTMNRKLSRIRTNSVSILNADGDDVVSTSFGPVIIPDAGQSNRDWMLGWFLAVISGVLFTANNFFVKYLNLDALEILLVRSTLQSMVVLVGIISTKTPLLPASTKDRVLVILQGALSGVRVFLQFACLSFMPLGDALTLVFTEPLWTIILSKIILKIHIGWWKMIFGIILVGGMILTIQPPFIFHPDDGDTSNNTDVTTTPAYISTTEFATTFLPVNASMFTTERSVLTSPQGTLNNSFLLAPPSQNPQHGDRLRDHPVLSKFLKITGVERMRESYEARRGGEDGQGGDQPEYQYYFIGAILALSTAISGSLANVIIAKCESVSSSVMVFYSGLGGVVLALVCSSMDADNRIVFDIGSIPYDEWLILIMLGGSGLLGYYSMTRSLQLIPPTTVAVLRALEIILAYVAQACIMGEIPNPLAITGSSLVMICVIAFALEETVMSCYYCF